jgi:hypothetical protein
VILSVISDAAKAVVTAAAHRIAAYADRNQIPLDQTQSEELADHLVHMYKAFFAGLTRLGLSPAG